MRSVTRREFIKLTAGSTCACLIGCHGASTPVAAPAYDAAKLMADFDNWLMVSGTVVTDLLGPDGGAAALVAIRANYADIILQIPWIGGESSRNTYNLLGSASSMALIKPLEALGVTPHNIGHTMYLMAQASFQADGEALQQQGAYMFDEATIDGMRQGAVWSQKRVYAGDFVFDFVEPQCGYAYGIKMTECAIQKFYRQQNLDKYVRYNCLLDYPMYQIMGVHLDRTQTLGNRGTSCDFNYLATGLTPDGWPPENRPEFSGDPA